MCEAIANVEVVILLALFCSLCVASLICLVMDKVRERRKDKEEKAAWYDYSELKVEVASLKREVEKLQGK